MKFRAIHLLTNPLEEREQRSICDITRLIDFGIEYVPVINHVWNGALPPAREAGDRPFVLTHAHYGCYNAHKQAILNYLKPDIDALLLFECDAVFSLPTFKIVERIERAWQACMEGSLDVFTFGPKHNGKTIDTVGNDVIVITQFIETHAYMIPLKSSTLMREILSKPWDALDYVYTIYLYDRGNYRIGTFKDRAVSVQAKGVSLITGQTKNSEDHWKYKLYD